MVKLISLIALSTLIIAPTFASAIWDIETRDVAVPHLFGRDMEGLFAREQDFELPDLVRRFPLSGASPSGAAEENPKKPGGSTPQQRALHEPFHKHELRPKDELLERDLDRELFMRDVIDDDLFERFFDDLY